MVTTYQVHLTGNIPVKGKMSVIPGTRVDELIFSPLLFEYGIGMAKNLAFRESELDLRNIFIIRRGKTGDQDTLIADLYAYNFGGLLEWNPVLMDGDVIKVNRRSSEEEQVSVSGSVSTPLVLPFRQGDSAALMVELSGGRTSDAMTGELHVLRDPKDGGPVQRVVLTDREASSFLLTPSDMVIVPRRSDLSSLRVVRIDGEVLNPGLYPVRDNETTLADVLLMAGGPTALARTNGVRVQRKSDPAKPYVDPQDDLDLEQILTRISVPSAANQNTALGLSTQSEYWTSDIMRLSDQYLESFELLKAEILMDRNVLYADLDDPASLSAIQIQDGDVVTVERMENTVRLMGQISMNGSLTFQQGAGVMDYIERAGGYGPAADPERVFIIKAGSRSWKRPDDTIIEPGDIILVDRTPMITYGEDRQISLLEFSTALQQRGIRTQTIFSAISTVLSITTTYILIRDRR